MLSDEDSNITINGIEYPWPFAINGIAMSPTFNYVYYSALGSKKLWQIPTFVLRRKGADFSSYARLVGNKVSNSDAMVFGRKGLYYGALGLDAVFMWDAQQDIANEGVIEGKATIKTQKPLIQNWETIQWPDGITISDSRDRPDSYLYFVAARAQLFHSGTLDFTGGQGVNFRIFKLRINDDSYLSDKSVGGARPLFPVVG
ncbi:unnamed protein product [Lymnaea stagnalis]|uniref:Uncharacterized protein n=1 Tax=Lymnaea stagnalis TaxID=6523 RepID=A0AAV2HTH5_LYMST